MSLVKCLVSIRRCCTLLVCCVLASSAAADSSNSLSILLTNDDGFDSAGIHALRDALSAAGHVVTIVAPAGQRSGSGMKITLGKFALTEHAPRVWSVDASPADAVSVALRHIMREQQPDLVVSGANFGQNLGNNTMISGTVGAAMMAVLDGIPALAVSVGLDLKEAKAEPEHFPSTRAAFPAAAALTTRLITALASAERDQLLPAGTMLNINYPARPAADIKSVRWATVSQHGGFSLIYPEHSESLIRSWIEPDQRGFVDMRTDTALFNAGHVTISILTPDWNAVSANDSLRVRLAKIIDNGVR